MDDVVRLFDAHHDALVRYLHRVCGDADLAADGAQEAFVRALEAGREAPTRGWLFTVGTNYVLDRVRTQARRQRLLALADARAPLADPPRDPHESVEARARHDAVREALAMLTEKERVALLMREEGFAHREIAGAVGTTTGSVGTLIARALDKLAPVLAAGRETL